LATAITIHPSPSPPVQHLKTHLPATPIAIHPTLLFIKQDAIWNVLQSSVIENELKP
jgi:hypothetical protein